MKTPVSQESEIDRQISSLMVKVAKGSATEAERKKFRELSVKRVRLMRPNLVGRVQWLRMP
tara:strand:+ start:1176 stop:1358 length:183 start_codon:yes stop_codon:yes gene_type:complete